MAINLEDWEDLRTDEQKIIDLMQWNFQDHLCCKCNRIYDFPNYETTQDPHPCPYAYKDWEIKDNGMGHWVKKCKYYIPIDTKRLYKTWIHSEEWKDIAWIKKRSANFQCELCGSAKNLVVHHITYENMLFEEEHMDDLLCVCKKCHEKLHEHDLKTAQENAVKNLL